MSGFLFDSWIPGLILFSALYISDYTWTIANARLYRSKANQYIVFEGSFELTPYFQKDIDALRRVSPRFVLAFILMNGILAALWFIRRLVPGMEPMHMMFLGCIVLLQCTIHLRHFRTWHLFRSMRAPSGIVGRIEYRRPVILRASASEMFSFAGMWLLLAAVLGSWFFFGGAIQVPLSVSSTDSSRRNTQPAWPRRARNRRSLRDALALHGRPDRGRSSLGALGRRDEIGLHVFAVVVVECRTEVHPVAGDRALGACLLQEGSEHVEFREQLGVHGVGIEQPDDVFDAIGSHLR